MSDLRLYLVPNGRDSKLFCPECMAQAPREGDYVLRCDVGLPHAYVCTGVSRGWLVGCKVCESSERTGLVVHTWRLRDALDGEGCRVLDGFLGLLALARG